MRKPLLGASAALLILAGTASTGWSRGDKPMIEITPFYGYQWGGGTTVYEGDLNIKSASNVGFTVDITVLEEYEGIVQFEFFYSRQDTKLELRRYGTGFKQDLSDIAIEYYHGGAVYLFDTGSFARPFAAVTMGATRAAPKGSAIDDEWYFSFAFAGGVKMISKSGIGARLQGRLLMPVISGGSGIWCGFPGSCGVTVGGYTTVQADLQAGLIIGL